MKHIVVFFINVYQIVLSPLLKMILGTNRFCRFSLSCSEYAKISILKYGVLKGGYLSTVRLLSCQPFNSKLHRHMARMAT